MDFALQARACRIPSVVAQSAMNGCESAALAMPDRIWSPTPRRQSLGMDPFTCRHGRPPDCASVSLRLAMPIPAEFRQDLHLCVAPMFWVLFTYPVLVINLPFVNESTPEKYARMRYPKPAYLALSDDFRKNALDAVVMDSRRLSFGSAIRGSGRQFAPWLSHLPDGSPCSTQRLTRRMAQTERVRNAARRA